jgi:hypothetical protein
MSVPETDLRQHESSIDRWLHSLKLSELRSLAACCQVEFPAGCQNQDIIDALQMARRDNPVTQSLFDALAGAATRLDVRLLREELRRRVARLDRRRQEAARREAARIEKRLKSLETEATKNQTLRVFYGILASVFSFLIMLAGFAGFSIEQTLDRMDDTADRVEQLEPRVQASVDDASQSTQLFQDMIQTLSTHTGIAMIAKLNTRLDRLRSMRMYHIQPTIKELEVDIEGDLQTLESLRRLLAVPGGKDGFRYLHSLQRITAAIRDLGLLYGDDGRINLQRLEQARSTWEELHRDVDIIEHDIRMITGGQEDRVSNGPGVFDRLDATVYLVEAGLAIQAYREDLNNQATPRLLNVAAGKCAAALQEDDSAVMVHIYGGLLASLKLTRQRQDNEPLEVLASSKREGEQSYRRAVEISTLPELKVYAQNGLAYLCVKTSNAYLEAAESASEDRQRQRALEREARKLLDEARRAIANATQAAMILDPIVVTTEADIEIMNLRLLSDEEFARIDREATYQHILELLRDAVAAGYTGYAQPADVFLSKRPHFRNLQRLNENWKRDVFQAVGVTETADPAEGSRRDVQTSGAGTPSSQRRRVAESARAGWRASGRCRTLAAIRWPGAGSYPCVRFRRAA